MTRRTTNPAGVNGGARSSKSVQLGGELLQHKASPAGKQESSELPHSAGIRGLERWDIVHGKVTPRRSRRFSRNMPRSCHDARLFSHPSRLSGNRRRSASRRPSLGGSSLCYVLPCGGGKTVVFAYLVAAAAAKGKRVLILAHRIEIIEQIAVALDSFGVSYGLIAPDAEATDHNVQIASVATLARRLDSWRDRFDLVVIDECHHAVAGSWSKIIASQPRAKFLGVTATPERLDGKGLSDVFELMVEGPTIAELIELLHLFSRFVAYAPAAEVDLSGARTRGGDYAIEDIRSAMGGVVIGAAVDEYLRLCPGVPAVAFCVDIAHSQQVAARFRAHGVRAQHLDGDTPAAERRRLIAALGTGDLTC